MKGGQVPARAGIQGRVGPGATGQVCRQRVQKDSVQVAENKGGGQPFQEKPGEGRQRVVRAVRGWRRLQVDFRQDDRAVS